MIGMQVQNEPDTAELIREPKESIVEDFMYGSNVASSHVTIRLGFLRKVYGILSVQLAFTTLVGALVMMSGISETIKANPWVMILNLLVTLVVLGFLIAKRKEYPLNFYLLGAFTFFQSFAVATIASCYGAWTVIQAFFLTTVIVVCLTLYTLQTKRDFSSMGALLFSGLILVITGGFLQIFIQSSLLHLSLSVFGAFLFSGFIIFDTQMIMKTLSPEEYIVAVVNLYLDIINLFLEILKILDAMKR